jgi:hypothetical protein
MMRLRLLPFLRREVVAEEEEEEEQAPVEEELELAEEEQEQGVLLEPLVHRRRPPFSKFKTGYANSFGAVYCNVLTDCVLVLFLLCLSELRYYSRWLSLRLPTSAVQRLLPVQRPLEPPLEPPLERRQQASVPQERRRRRPPQRRRAPVPLEPLPESPLELA